MVARNERAKCHDPQTVKDMWSRCSHELLQCIKVHIVPRQDKIGSRGVPLKQQSCPGLAASCLSQPIQSEETTKTTVGGRTAHHKKTISQFDHWPLASQHHNATSCFTVPAKQDGRENRRVRPTGSKKEGWKLRPILLQRSTTLHKYGHFSPPSLLLRPSLPHVGLYGRFDIMKVFSTRTAFTLNTAWLWPMGLWQPVHHLTSRFYAQKSRSLRNGTEKSGFLYGNVVF